MPNVAVAHWQASYVNYMKFSRECHIAVQLGFSAILPFRNLDLNYAVSEDPGEKAIQNIPRNGLRPKNNLTY